MKNNKKQTAVMQLIEELGWNKNTLWSQKYLELEKQQMRDFFDVGFNVGYNDDESPSFLTSEQHYKETFE